jgi:hypothetical protein
LFVEVDIVMAPERTLREVHDVSQELQDKLESVEEFGRAFIHVDYGKLLNDRSVACVFLLRLLDLRNVSYARTPENSVIKQGVATAFWNELVIIRLTTTQRKQAKSSFG